jgi:hypothetical protein
MDQGDAPLNMPLAGYVDHLGVPHADVPALPTGKYRLSASVDNATWFIGYVIVEKEEFPWKMAIGLGLGVVVALGTALFFLFRIRAKRVKIHKSDDPIGPVR